MTGQQSSGDWKVQTLLQDRRSAENMSTHDAASSAPLDTATARWAPAHDTVMPSVLKG